MIKRRIKPNGMRPLVKHLTQPSAIFDALLTEKHHLFRSKYGQVLNLRRLEAMRMAEITLRNKSVTAWQRAACTRKPPQFHEEVQESLLYDFRDATIPCSECEGSGRVHSHNDICSMCKGTGRIKDIYEWKDGRWIQMTPGTVGIAPEDAGPVQPGEPPQQDGRSDLLQAPDPHDDSTTNPRI